MNAPPRPKVQAVIGLGSNIGDKVAHIHAAISLLTADGHVRVLKSSALYRTAPWGYTDQDWFVNACILIETEVSARELLSRCLETEQLLGRVRDTRWGPRLIDLDILVYNEETIMEPGLTIPHPEIANRAFVLVPLVEIAPDVMIDFQPASAWLAGIDRSDVIAL
jgi:2-amino-4-hydroxy-6-hydroxymethyldihydropteridine diphosphokinase